MKLIFLAAAMLIASSGVFAQAKPDAVESEMKKEASMPEWTQSDLEARKAKILKNHAARVEIIGVAQSCIKNAPTAASLKMCLDTERHAIDQLRQGVNKTK